MHEEVRCSILPILVAVVMTLALASPWTAWATSISQASPPPFPTTPGAFGRTFNGLIDGFVTKLDLRAPRCEVTERRPGPPVQFVITTQDTGTGLAAIQVTKAVNAKVSVPTFTPGTKQPVIVLATKVDQTQPLQVILKVTDRAANVTTCDPEHTLVLDQRGAGRQTFSGIPQAEHV